MEQPRRSGVPLNEGRGRSPGDRPAVHGVPTPFTLALNEGRGRSPGDSSHLDLVDGEPFARSTKAGAEAPATAAVN